MEARDSGQKMVELEERYHVHYRRALAIRKRIETITADLAAADPGELSLARALLEHEDRERAAVLREIEAIEDRLLD